MYVEKRKAKNSIKYYLAHSYREKNEVKKIRKYLGVDLTSEELAKRKKEVGKIIFKLIEELNTEIFNFFLTKKQLEILNKYDKKIKISHLEKIDWKRFTEDFVYNTNAIEGSTVNIGEVKKLLEKNKPPENTDEYETKNVAKALKFVRGAKEDLSLEFIKKIHKLCFRGIKPFAGKFRNVEVVVRNPRGEILHTGVPVSELKEYLDDFIEWYKESKTKFKPLIMAAIIHNQFEHIHPFQDGNGRVGRLLLNFILIKNKYPPINIELSDRAEYYYTLQEYSKNDNLRPTIKFLVKQYKKTLRKVSTKK